MNCYECAIRGETVAAVATCRNCGVGLCLEHLAEAQSYRVGGTLYACPHDLRAAQRVLAAPASGGNGRVRVPAGLRGEGN
jgi:hypothetical protein